jgi:hypothetical protein
MARARTRPGRTSSEISEVILAEWFRILPDASLTDRTGYPLAIDINALSAAFNFIIDEPCIAVPDVAGQPLKIIVPLPPQTVETKQDLEAYLRRNGDFVPGMGAAVLFGCGR